jgi:hypothetical protein
MSQLIFTSKPNIISTTSTQTLSESVEQITPKTPPEKSSKPRMKH